MKVKKASHCAYQTHYHIVFPVKYRKALLDVKVEKRILELAREISERYEIEFEQIGCDRNHIHILCSFHPKYSIGEGSFGQMDIMRQPLEKEVVGK